jgi:hypothetical protein
MYCPSCGTEERQPGQFCRACGTDMRIVRNMLEKPDSVTNSAVTARYEISRAIAKRIQELRTTKELKQMAEEVLPEIEKFLESPEERRLRRMRAGIVTTAVGLGVALIIFMNPMIKILGPLIYIGWPGGILVALIGLGVLLNGLLFSVPANRIPDRSQEGQVQNLLDQLPHNIPISHQEDNSQARFINPPSSVTEHTTQQLPKDPIKRPDLRTTR